MNKTTRRRALPVYIAALSFALYALIFPLYSLLHFFLAAVVTAAVWLLADRLIKPITVYVPEDPQKEEAPVSYGAEVDAVLREAETAGAELSRLAASIGNQDIREKIFRLTELSNSIAADAISDPADIPAIRKFQNYFLPSTIALLNSYDRMGDISGPTVGSTKERISQMLDTEIAAFEKQLDSLYNNDAMNVDADIRVMQNLLEREGLLEQDELHRILAQMQKADTGGTL